ncbi:MAG: LTA synthase family protein [Lachnospiraceae bacterium]|nr:LTA synthase family protein [Lachnospiraceae bacterium]
MNQKFEKMKKYMPYGIVLMMSVLNFIQLELCNGNDLRMPIRYIGMNVGVLVCLYMVMYALTKRLHMTILLGSTASTVLGILNYYVIAFRGTPVSTKDLKNLQTALSVVANYEFTVDKRVIITVLVFGFSIAVAVFCKKKIPVQKEEFPTYMKRLFLAVAGSVLFFYICFFAEHSLKPKNTFGWSWEMAYHEYGFLAESLEIMEASWTTVSKPDDYSAARRQEILSAIETEEPVAEALPNIIFILNESWYDLETIVSIDCEPITPYINSMENVLRGYCMVPMVGTNLSEYEFLTGNSLQLMQGITPFNSLNMSGQESIVTTLKTLGYRTTAMHPAISTNYSRNVAYPAMGFDEILFIDDFATEELYGVRPHLTDSAAFETLIQRYEANKGQGPQFLYLLTIQNHGGWEVNPEELNSVSVQNDFGVYREMTEEYLSCLQLTDQAWEELVTYFEKVEEPTIICMVGDHAPSFADTLSKYWSGMTDEELAILLNSTPYIIWSNYGLEMPEIGDISMNYMAASVLELAGIRSDAYYNYMNQMRKEVPVMSAFNLYLTSDGIQYSYTDANEYSDWLKDYFILEYGRIRE